MRLFLPLALCISVLFATARSRGEPEKPKQEPPVVKQESGKDAEEGKVVNTVSIAGPPGPVFDLVTSARFWKTWHPATYAVAGVTERPYLLGDVIHERVRFAGKDVVVTWKVVEHVRPSRVVLQSQTSSSRITYSLKARGEVIEFRRELEYDEARLRKANPDLKEPRKLMHEQSEEGLRRLRELVEKTLRAEAAGF